MYLPYSNAGSWLCKWSPICATQFERVRPNLDQIVRQCPESGHWVNRRKEEDVAELNKHLKVVIQCTLQPNKQAVVEAKSNFVPNRSLELYHPLSHHLKVSRLVDLHHACPVVFWSLSANELLQGPHHHWHIRC